MYYVKKFFGKIGSMLKFILDITVILIAGALGIVSVLGFLTRPVAIFFILFFSFADTPIFSFWKNTWNGNHGFNWYSNVPWSGLAPHSAALRGKISFIMLILTLLLMIFWKEIFIGISNFLYRLVDPEQEKLDFEELTK